MKEPREKFEKLAFEKVKSEFLWEFVIASVLLKGVSMDLGSLRNES
jgi:hypothetical protein